MKYATESLIGGINDGANRTQRQENGGESDGRVAELDSLRGVAIGLVLVFHSNQAWLPWGWAGVDLFFVLSGYLITAIILKHGRSPGFLLKFYVRRGLRTWPIYYLTIGLLVLSSPFLTRPFFWSSLPYILTYTQNLPGTWSGEMFRFTAYTGHTWTLAVEEQFYLVWPLLVLAGGRRLVPLLAIGCVIGSVLARNCGFGFNSLISQADGLALGALLAAIRFDPRSSGAQGSQAAWWKSVVPVVGTIMLLVAVQSQVGVATNNGLKTHPGLVVLAFHLFWLSVLNLVLNHAGRSEIRWLRIRALAQLGTISYGVYLYHFPLAIMAHELSDAFGLWLYVAECRLAGCLAAIPIAVLSWRYVEKPILGLKSRFQYGAASALRRGSGDDPDRLVRPGPHFGAFKTLDQEKLSVAQRQGAETGIGQ